MTALVILLLGFFAIGAIFTYYLIIAMLVLAGTVFMGIVGISLMVGSAIGPIAGLLTFAMLTTGACITVNACFKAPERSHEHE